MVRATERLRLPGRLADERLAVPRFWPQATPPWLRERGKTVVIVIDDMIQSAAQLSDEDALRRRMTDPLDVELIFCPECRAGGALAREGRWIPAAEDLVARHRPRLAAIFLDLVFEGDKGAASGSGLEFLNRLRLLELRIPVLILTGERDERPLQAALSRQGRHHAFLRKGEGDVTGGLVRFLIEQGWVTQPEVGAFSAAMREQVCRLRQYAFAGRRLDSGLPEPILIIGESGAGKSHLAHWAADWLLSVQPALRPKQAVETFIASELERGQSATIELFGRGPLEPAERAVLPGLAVLGKAQKADEGILIVEELGNSSHELQRLLLGFVETGKTQPLFQTSAMDKRALGPLDVLCIFTAQPLHLDGGVIIDDLLRRAKRGDAIVEIPSLHDRVEDIVPIFYANLKSSRRSSDPAWREPELVDEIILPEAQTWLEEVARERRLSASGLADLVGSPRIAIIGIPYLEDQLRRKLPAVGPATDDDRTAVKEGEQAGTADAWRQTAGWRGDAFVLVSQLADDRKFSFPRDQARLRGRLKDVEAAAVNLLLSYLEACLEVVKGTDEVINVTGTYKFQTGEKGSPTNQAKGEYGKLFDLERQPQMVLSKLQSSDLLASLALAIGAGNRRRGVAGLIKTLAANAGSRDRLLRLLALLRPGDERRKAEELLSAPGPAAPAPKDGEREDG